MRIAWCWQELQREIGRLRRFRQYRKWRTERLVMDAPDGPERFCLQPYDELRCIYVHVPKSAGVAIRHSLFGGWGRGHTSAEEYRMIFGLAFWRYFKFTFVRNPYARLVSAYEYLRDGGHPAWPADRQFAASVLSQYPAFDGFVLDWLNAESAAKAKVVHFRPQVSFLEIEGENVMNFTGKLENFAQDYAFVCRKLGVHSPLVTKNARRRRSTSLAAYYRDPAVRRRVSEVYWRDFEELRYSDDLPT